MLSREIDYFLAVQKAGSVSKAAEMLYISQPSLSQFLIRLEKRLGAQLFDRSKNPWALTDIGRCYAEYANEARQLESQLTDDITSIRSGSIAKQTLSIGIPPWKGSLFLPEILSECARRFPGVSFLVYEESATKLRDLLLRGVISIAIMNTPFYDKHIVYEKLIEERIFLATAKDHPLVEGIRTSYKRPAYFDIAQICDQRLIIPGPEQILTLEVRNLLGKLSLTPRRMLYLKSILTCMNLAAAGYGFTFVPELGADQCPHFDRLAFFTLDQPPLSWSLSVVYRHQKTLDAASKAFLEITKKWFGRLPRPTATQ